MAQVQTLDYSLIGKTSEEAVAREVPTPSDVEPALGVVSQSKDVDTGWVAVCDVEALKPEDVMRFERGEMVYALYRSAEGQFYASDGLCTHGRACLADGVVMGHVIECPKHNGRFDLRDGSPQRMPVRVPLKMYPVKVADEKVLVRLEDEDDGQRTTDDG